MSRPDFQVTEFWPDKKKHQKSTEQLIKNRIENRPIIRPEIGSNKNTQRRVDAKRLRPLGCFFFCFQFLVRFSIDFSIDSRADFLIDFAFDFSLTSECWMGPIRPFNAHQKSERFRDGVPAVRVWVRVSSSESTCGGFWGAAWCPWPVQGSGPALGGRPVSMPVRVRVARCLGPGPV